MPGVRLTILRAQPAELASLSNVYTFLFFHNPYPLEMRETHQAAQLLANMAALHRNKLLIVNSGILTGKRIVV